ncbi:MAG: RNA 2',3'-cyclic phosphodiesterase [Candidatus Scalindua sp. AMX11]|nr:MAG: RNA 2',3'-cyclic phosphodiesterase [Candidatus Scalindua sp.]NOG83521.1 RNA 2',3'-cyclic phosphodiesterase [Planctomycetota bacterium]RZV72073.1 MAG: RNA 2',3'-cyclic phosphodiesterase [Candidatus Scalindua sp. SCAELEC01]TDE64376.1 MAG: RNA 2',3'-cyclic phosphodiesterase [Candidatus Scalindua sp. AMX11]GJQ59877.1 MAG: RNA 2',3'-cyclic phosphodiesterase [Candidatus Scalindua sp.]
MRNDSLRLFIAIEIEKRIKERILEFLNQLKETDVRIRWMAYENLHVTVKFIGDVDPIILPSLVKSLESVASRCRPFRIQIGNVAVFPTAKRPRILFVGLGDKENNLVNIFEEVETEIEEFGIKRELRKYVGHITIGRIKSQKNIHKILELLPSYSDRFFGQETVNHITLKQSELTPKGPIYSTLNRFTLYKNEYRNH